jgi:hypothetical protein
VSDDWDELSSEEMEVFRQWQVQTEADNRHSAHQRWVETWLPLTVELDADYRSALQEAVESAYMLGMADAMKGLILNRRDDTPLPEWVKGLNGL